jgi:uncharacterized membrane protein YbhN (UPF0104 family)
MNAGVRPVETTMNGLAANDGSKGHSAQGPAGGLFRLLLRTVVVIAVVVVLVSQRASLLSAAGRLGRVSPAWLVLALGAETASYLAAAELQHHLLAGTGVRVGRRSLVALLYAGTAMSAALPAGPAVSTRYTYRALRRRGAPAGTAAWLSMVTLAAFGLVGAQLRGVGLLCSALGGILGVTVLAGATGALAALIWASRHRRRVEQLATSASARCRAGVRAVARRFGRAAGAAEADPAGAVWLIDDAADQGDRALGPGRVAVALGLATLNWAADLLVLAIAFVALGLEVPWQGLLLAYAITQLATSVPVLPGSLGVAEGSMAAALVCSGVRPTAALAGVLVYRLVSFWLVLPAGWLAWTCLRRGDTRSSAPRTGPFDPVPQLATI